MKGKPTPRIAIHHHRPGSAKELQHASINRTAVTIFTVIKIFFETLLRMRDMLKITTHLQTKHGEEYLFLHPSGNDSPAG